MNWMIYLDGLLVILVLAVLTWLLSLRLRDVSIVDSAWSLMFLGAAIAYLLNAGNIELRNTLILIMVSIWAIRLSAHLTWRNWGEPEDKRYQEIRKKYSPNFGIKSLFIIFLFQAALAWIITMPLYASLTLPGTSLSLDVVGVALWLAGLSFESVADWQLARFKANPDNQGKVMDKGLWRYSRHPNYFGECLIWWGFYLLAVSSGGWWTIVAPLLITWLLLKFSGVVMLEETIVNRRPAYADYIKRTNAFIPGPVKSAKTTNYQEEHAK
jgi:steroid 5-alpha reductase family enzyme